jgi:hypothetical protein
LRSGEQPSLVAEDEDGREHSLSLGWDPRNPPSKDRPAGDFEGVLQALDELLDTVGESPDVLGAKLLTLVQLRQPDERIQELAERFLEVTAEKGADVPRSLALGRLLVGRTLETCGELFESAQALSDVASFYGTEADPIMRAVAVWALDDRIFALLKLRDFTGAGAAWESVRAQFGAEIHPAVRSRVADAGMRVAVGLLRNEQTEDAVRAATDVIDRYEQDTQTSTRSYVAVAMMVRLVALPKRQIRARTRALQDLRHFIGSNPEPELVEAMREAHPEVADWVLRGAHDPH